MTTFLSLFDINTTFFTIIGYPMSYLEFFGTIFNILCVRLVARNKIINWPIGILGVILYIFLFYQIQLYADLFEQVYFLITGFYGRWAWSHIRKSKSNTTTTITHTSTKENILYVLSMLIGLGVLRYTISHLHIRLPNYFPEAASYPRLDACTTILSFAATLLMAHKKIECWYLWIIVDICGIWLYYVKGVKFISFEYVIFLILAIGGLIQWRRAYKKNILV